MQPRFHISRSGGGGIACDSDSGGNAVAIRLDLQIDIGLQPEASGANSFGEPQLPGAPLEVNTQLRDYAGETRNGRVRAGAQPIKNGVVAGKAG